MLQTKKLRFHLYLFCIPCDKVFLLISQIKSQKLAGTGDLLSPFLPYCPVIIHCIMLANTTDKARNLSGFGEGNGTPLQYSCLENPKDGGAWQDAVHGGHYESDTTERLHCHFSLSCIGEGNGNPLQCSCLENPRDGGAWWAAISGVAQSRT